MRKSRLFASFLAAAAGLIGVNQTAMDTGSAPGSAYAQASFGPRSQTTGTDMGAPPAMTTVQRINAGQMSVPLAMRYAPTPRWAWVGRKVNGRFGYYCRRVGA